MKKTLKSKKPVRKTRSKLHTKRAAYLLVALAVVLIFGLAWRLLLYVPSSSQVMLRVERDVKAKYVNLGVNTSQWPAQMGSQLSLHASGYDFNVSSQSMTSIYIGMTDTPQNADSNKVAEAAEAAHAVISNLMRSYWFKVDKANSKLPVVVYGRRDATCLEIYDSTQAVLTFTCYGHDQIATKSKEMQPFVTAYNKANVAQPITSAYTVGPVVIKSHYGAGVIGSSHAAGYDIAEAVVTKGTTKKLVLFYEKYGGDWQYITQASDEFGFSCNDYRASSDARIAMYDQICLGIDGQVRLDTNNRALQ